MNLAENDFLCLGFGEIRDRIEEHLRVNALQIESALESHDLTAVQVSRMLLRNYAEEALLTARFHVYRGTLNVVGRDLLAIFKRSNSELVEYGLLTAKEAEEEETALGSELASLG